MENSTNIRWMAVKYYHSQLRVIVGGFFTEQVCKQYCEHYNLDYDDIVQYKKEKDDN